MTRALSSHEWIKWLWLNLNPAARQVAKLRPLIAKPDDPDLSSNDVYIAGRPEKPFSLARVRARQAALLAQQGVAVETPHGIIRFANFGKQSTSRAASLLTKEPGTIAWIDSMPTHAVLWDVGANIGPYSLYAARRGLKVVAIEPVAVNYWLLCANIELNDLCDRIIALPFGLDSRDGLAPLFASQFQPAKAPGFKVRKPYVPERARQTAPTLTGATLLSFGAPFPNHIKIDVFKVTGEVLEGLVPLLGDRKLESMQIEIGRGARRRRELAEFLAPYGLHPLPEPEQSEGKVTSNWIYRRAEI